MINLSELLNIDKEEYARGNRQRTKVKIAALGNDAGIIGAAMLGF